MNENETNEQLTEPPVPDEAPAPVVPSDPEVVAETPPAEPKPSFAERMGGPASRLRTMQGSSVVALAAGSFVLLIATVLLALMVFAPGIAPFRLGSSKSGYAAQRDLAIEKVALRFARNFMTFDYRTLDANLAAMQKDVTGNFSSQVTGLRKDKTITGELVSQQATSKAQVLGESFESLRGDTATVRIFLDQIVTNKANAQPRSTFRILTFTLVKTAQGWKVDNVG